MMRKRFKDGWRPDRSWILTVVLLLAAQAPAASAYVGPGAGLGMLAALFAIILAGLATLVGLVLWPIRKLRQRRASRNATTQAAAASGDTSAEAGPRVGD